MYEETPTLIVISDGKNWIYRGTLSEDDLYKACMNHSIKIAPVNSLEEVSYADLTAMMNEPLDFVLYIGRDDCRDCQKFMPILEQYINNESTLIPLALAFLITFSREGQLEEILCKLKIQNRYFFRGNDEDFEKP